MAEADDILRRSLADRYDVERELGEGGMATVYLANDVRHGRKVAIKVIRHEVAETLGTDRFLSEIKVTASLQHPHILALLDSGVVSSASGGNRPFYVMPYITGETLRARLTRERTLPVRDTLGVLGEVADALASAHGQDIVHRDIKPENILLNQGHAVVTDFGVAKALHRSLDGSSSTGIGITIETPAYMAPEQAVGDPAIDHRADLYALGVVGFELLTGRTPFSGPNVAAMISAMLSRPAPLVTSDAPACPPRLANLIDALLSRDPARRPETAAEVRDTLRSILVDVSSGPIAARRTRRILGGRRVLIGALLTAGIMATAGLAIWRPWQPRNPASGATPRKEATPRSIAVLPFENVNRDSTTDYFSDGMAEELISALGRLRGLRVASRTSTFALKGQVGGLADVGRKLGVQTVLEGSVRRYGDQVRVTARLVDVARDSTLWGGEYTNELKNVLFVQDTIARAIVSALSVALGEAGTGLSRPRSGNPEAYDAYLRGRYFLGRRNAVSIATAIRSFEAAITKDSSFAPAYAGLADAYSLAAPFGGRRPRDVFELARAAANRALTLDSTVAEAHTSLGIVAIFYDWDWPAAAKHLARAVELNPSYAEGHLFYAWYLLLRGRSAEAEAEIARAHALDQLSVVIAARRGTMLQYAGRDAEAIPFFREALELDSTFFHARADLAAAYVATGQPDSARRVVPRTALFPGSGEAGMPVWVLVQLGDTAAARQSLRDYEATREHTYVAADALAAMYASLGDSTRALELLEQASEERAFTLVFLANYPMFRSLYKSARFRRLVDRMGVAPPACVSSLVGVGMTERP
jgi:serine/threonine protein kinase/tetratricopeptide (TPR) repeat protein